jgi:prepilin-type N-terminal cleavage/methylation domain-containing protein
MRKRQTATAQAALSIGFNIIELLVVISVIGLLMGILLPALGRARAVAQQTVCQSRLRQWGIAFGTYAAENDGFYPHIDGLDRDASRADTFGWIDMLPPLMGEKPWCEHKLWHKPKIDTIFQCPSAIFSFSNLYNYNPERNGYFSYAMNSCLELDKNCWPPHDRPQGNNMPSFLNTAKIHKPARVILLFDQLLDPEKGYGGKKLNRSAGRYCGSYPKSFSARHSKIKGELGGSILYCDYHVEWVGTVWKPEWPDELEVPPRGDSSWYPYP